MKATPCPRFPLGEPARPRAWSRPRDASEPCRGGYDAAVRPFLAAAAGLLSVCSTLAPAQTAAKEDPWVDVVAPFVERHCLACHDASEATAEIVLEGDESVLDADLGSWKKSLLRIEDGSMPPQKSERPAPDELRAVSSALRALIVAREGAPPQAPVLRRLTRREWRASVEALFGVSAPEVEQFPDDDVAAGFENVGAVLATSAVHLEKQLAAAEAVAARAVQDEDAPTPPLRRMSGGVGPESRSHAPNGAVRVLFSNGAWGFEHVFPRDGEYRLRVRWQAQQAGPDAVRAELRIGGRAVDACAVEGGEWQEREWRGRATRGRQRVTVAFVNDWYEPPQPASGGLPARAARDRNLLVEHLELEGPLDAPVFGAWQDAQLRREPRPALGTVVRVLLRDAWRRPPSDEEVARLCALGGEDATLEERVRIAIVAALASPHFLYKVEQAAAPGEARELDPYERAVRLSYYLAGAPPDAALAAAADDGSLRRAEVWSREASRLLDSPAADGFLDDFVEQWLGLRALRHHRPDPLRHPEHDAALAEAMRAETLALARRVLREGLPARALLESPSTRLDERLAAHYGVVVLDAEGAAAAESPRAPWLHEWDDPARHGLLGHASILTLTSRPGRTSPVLRGKWLLETLLGEHPPPPPPGVGALEDTVAAEAATLRDKLELHRRDAACAACHAALDPLGFGLERFDEVGRWRATDDGFPVDDSGVLPDGRAFEGAAELRAILLADERFEAALLAKLFVYATGRLPELPDREELAAALRQAGPRPTLRTLVLAIVHLPAFTRRVERGTLVAR